jgi:hypothetical protein
VVFAEFRRANTILPDKGLTVCPFRHIAAVFAFFNAQLSVPVPPILMFGAEGHRYADGLKLSGILFPITKY